MSVTQPRLRTPLSIPTINYSFPRFMTVTNRAIPIPVTNLVTHRTCFTTVLSLARRVVRSQTLPGENHLSDARLERNAGRCKRRNEGDTARNAVTRPYTQTRQQLSQSQNNLASWLLGPRLHRREASFPQHHTRCAMNNGPMAHNEAATF
jgi:hypothetical protein